MKTMKKLFKKKKIVPIIVIIKIRERKKLKRSNKIAILKFSLTMMNNGIKNPKKKKQIEPKDR